MKKNMLNKVRRTKRIRLTNSIRRILEREKLPKDGQLLLVLTRYGRELICRYQARAQRFLPGRGLIDYPGPPYSFSRHEISSWKVTDEKV